MLLPISVQGNVPLPPEPRCLARFYAHKALSTHSDFGFPARPQAPPGSPAPHKVWESAALELYLQHLGSLAVHPFL